MTKRKRHSIEGEEEKSYGGVFALLIVIVLIVGVAYSILFGAPPQPPRGSSGLLAQSLVAIESMDKESFTFDGALKVSDSIDFLDLPLSGEGRIDLTNRRMNFKLNLGPDLGTGPGTSESLTVETYTIGDTVYTGLMGDWSKFALGGTVWGGSKFSSKLISMAQGFDSSIREREIVNGREAIKVEVDATVEDLLDIFSTVQTGTLDSTVDKLARGITDIEMVIWIDAQDFLPVKTSLGFALEGREISLLSGGVDASEVRVEVNINFDYKTPFNIVLPSAAQRAETVEI